MLTGGIVNRKALSLPDPGYPPAAATVRASGQVLVQIIIETDGSVSSAKTVAGHPLLRPAAEDAARQAKFAPTLLNGTPVKVSGVISYNFEPSPEPGSTVPGHGSAAVPSMINGGILNGKAEYLARPEYPPSARAVEASGEVAVKVVIDTDGSVLSAEATSGHPLLRGVSVDAARNAKFSPTTLNGQPVKVVGVIKYNFVP